MEVHPGWIAVLFGCFLSGLLFGIPVAWALGGSAFLVTGFCAYLNSYSGGEFVLDWNTFSLSVERVYGLVESDTLVALPMFILMGHILDKSGVSRIVMNSISVIFGQVRGGLAMGVVIVGVLLAASTGIIGASVVLLGTICLPVMIQAGYGARISCGTICSAGTLGILIPPSIMLIIMADRLQLPVADLFTGSLLPGLLLAILYLIYILGYSFIFPDRVPVKSSSNTHIKWLPVLKSVAPVFLLIIIVLGSIFTGIAPPTEASGLGAFGAFIIALFHKGISKKSVEGMCRETIQTIGFLFAIFVGASCFALALRLLGGDDWIQSVLSGDGRGPYMVVALVLGLVFVLGFFLDWIEITLVVLPIISALVGDLPLAWADSWEGKDSIALWFAILCALVLQTSFLTPPVGFALFYLKGAVKDMVSPKDLYLGIIPFVFIQIIAVILIIIFPEIVTWLPSLD